MCPGELSGRLVVVPVCGPRDRRGELGHSTFELKLRMNLQHEVAKITPIDAPDDSAYNSRVGHAVL